MNDKQYQMEEDDIDRRQAEGLITAKQATDERRQMQRDYREDARESAREAYDRELERW